MMTFFLIHRSDETLRQAGAAVTCALAPIVVILLEIAIGRKPPRACITAAAAIAGGRAFSLRKSCAKWLELA
jgi:hypothetical protein